MPRVAPMNLFDDLTNDLWEPWMDRAPAMFRLLHPEIAECRRRRRFHPLSPRMLLGNPFFQPSRHFTSYDRAEDSDDSEPEELVYRVRIPSLDKKAMKSIKSRKELTCDKNSKNDAEAANDGDAVEEAKDGKDDRLVENASERLVAIALPLQPQKFSVRIDVSGYKPDNIAVKIRKRTVLIDAKHQETDPDTGVFVQKNLHRSYVLPSHVNPDAVVSSLDTNGILTVEAPQEGLSITHSKEKPDEVQDEDKLYNGNEIQNADP